MLHIYRRIVPIIKQVGCISLAAFSCLASAADSTSGANRSEPSKSLIVRVIEGDDDAGFELACMLSNVDPAGAYVWARVVALGRNYDAHVLALSLRDGLQKRSLDLEQLDKSAQYIASQQGKLWRNPFTYISDPSSGVGILLSDRWEWPTHIDVKSMLVLRTRDGHQMNIRLVTATAVEQQQLLDPNDGAISEKSIKKFEAEHPSVEIVDPGKLSLGNGAGEIAYTYVIRDRATKVGAFHVGFPIADRICYANFESELIEEALAVFRHISVATREQQEGMNEFIRTTRVKESRRD